MLVFGIALFAGTLAVLWLPALPPTGLFFFLLPFAVAAVRVPRWRWFIAFWLGAALAAHAAHRQIEDQLAPELDGEIVEITGVIIDLIEHDERRQRFRFRIESGRHGDRPVTLPREVRLGLYEPLSVATGERWRWRVKLRRPRGLANPGTFDYERWLFAERLGATGYVRDVAQAERLAPAAGQLRALVAGRVAALVDGRAGGLIRGLATGDRDGISDADWELLRQTGTAHLMAISGLHIGLVAGLGVLLTGFVRRRWLPHSSPAWPPAAGLLLALAYGALAGFSLPVQRALTGTAVLLGALGLRRLPAPGHAFGLALGLVLCVDPLAALSAGFWLSFGAVAAILYLARGRRPAAGKLRTLLAVQLGLFVLLAPLTVATFGQLPLTSPLANLVAIPVFGVLVVPLVLGGVLLLPAPEVAAGVFALAGHVLAGLLAWLEVLADAALDLTVPTAGASASGLAAIGAVLLLAPRALPSRMLGAWLLLPALAAFVPAWRGLPPLRLHFLDAGQGLAVIVETPRHTLVYDTGPGFGGSDAALTTVIPFLNARGRTPDRVLVSHGDADHAGGLESLRVRFPHAVVHGRVTGVEDCAGLAWRWEGVSFQVLHPLEGGGTDNDDSCVLRIEYGDFAALLTGDIEKRAERALLARGAPLAANVVLVPHHGSRTSSTRDFVTATRATLAITASGYGNQWGFPKADVITRWRDAGATLLDTGMQGAIEVTVDAGGYCAKSYRAQSRWWREPPATRETFCARFDEFH